MEGIATAGAATSSIFVTVPGGRVTEPTAFAAPMRCCAALLGADSDRSAAFRSGLSAGMRGEQRSWPVP